MASPKPSTYAGRTLDLTLFAFTRALDVVVGELWHRRRTRRVAAGKWTALERAVSRFADPAVFALSSGLVMWAWFYHPPRLPRAYNKWISSAAAVDPRLIEALRRCRQRTLIYGRDTGQADLLGGMCADYGWPAAWGDPARSVPFPCEMVHMGFGPSCEWHALSRFARSFRWAMTSKTTAARQTIDGGVCVGTGCVLCGWSILLENASRRKDMALFVAPRALATLFPRRYALAKQWRETVVFAVSTAVVMTCFRENPRRVRGMMGGVLGSVFRE
ncbi:hypothetical protein CHGG_07960 [Chaetomium globosum CBS 148.51]|uniref:Integral membrane protein n=1 Tax=Chaetomium globosum (strain ATCC 6205 / CBS 148.51 / DSM 1962 / NBRC 6347 / NRRL 1970) TaxID=306901 RepID=Q2GVP4_CHAGB|nr:uncharacterized protein CHGG_07960 [Chaetomium globosum CBS 148.51]EAQ86707.1 hypothetical protein CHGG_07960 [Chaetomium globosum CBS 148.51]